MTLLAAMIFIVSIELMLAILVFTKNKGSAVNRFFLGFSLAVIIWTISNYLADARFSFFWTKMTYVGSSGIAFFLVLFANRFGDTKYSWKWIDVYISLFTVVILLLIWIPKWLLIGVTPYAQGVNVNTGSLYIIYPVFFASAAILALWQMIRKYRNATGTSKDQLRVLLAGIVLSLIIGFLANSIIPLLTKNYQISKYGPFGAIFFIAFTAYAIVRHRLLDVRFVMRKAFLQVALSMTILFFTLVIVFSAARILGIPITNLTLIYIGSFALVVGLFFLNPLNHFFERVANRYFFTSLYNYQTTLEDLARKLTSVIELTKVIDLIAETIMQTMGLDRAGVLLQSSKDDVRRYIVAKVIGFNEQNGISLVRDNYLVQWLIEHRKLVIFDELEWLIEEVKSAEERKDIMRLKTNMTKIEASLVLPMYSKDALIGMIILGNKITGDAYTSDDLRLLQAIADQASIAVENARLYDEIQKFNKTLQLKVNEQTRDITQKNRQVEAANAQLQKMLKAQSEFLDIASHQLRTPVSVIRGIIEMIRDKDMARLPKEKQTEFIDNAFQKGAKLDQIINDILSASEFAGEKFAIAEKTPAIQLEDLVGQIVSGFKLEAEQRKIKLTYAKPTSPLPPIKGEERFLEQAISNFISNALKYTPSLVQVKEARAKRDEPGRVAVEVKQVKNDIVVSVSDNGIGIPKVEISKLFTKFTRASNARDMYTDGSGLGLYIVKEIVEGHRGKVWAESEQGKGSVFFMSLPVA
ncbi:MAG: ATP-binding protein [Parcubacteria group bacterium]